MFLTTVLLGARLVALCIADTRLPAEQLLDLDDATCSSRDLEPVFREVQALMAGCSDNLYSLRNGMEGVKDAGGWERNIAKNAVFTFAVEDITTTDLEYTTDDRATLKRVDSNVLDVGDFLEGELLADMGKIRSLCESEAYSKVTLAFQVQPGAPMVLTTRALGTQTSLR